MNTLSEFGTRLLEIATAWWANSIVRIIVWIMLGLIAVYIVLFIIAHFIPQSRNKDFPVDTEEANLLALGFQQITSSNNYWNDPTASLLAQDVKRQKALAEMWGLVSKESAIETLNILIEQRRRRPAWQQFLAIRKELAQQQGGKRPSKRDWKNAINNAVGSTKGDHLDFVDAVKYYESDLSKKFFPENEPVVNFDGYALGQAVAVATWAVGLGLFTQEEAMMYIKQANEIARAEFDSWAAFGRSFALGRAMHWSDGVIDEKNASRSRDAVSSAFNALDGKRGGPWGLLPWKI